MRYVVKLFLFLKKEWLRNWRKWNDIPPKSVNPPVDLFDSIKNLVINNWDEIKDTGNIFLLSRTKTQDRSNKLFRYCLDTWDAICDQEIKKFNTLNQEYFSKIAEVAKLNIDYAISQDNWDLFLLNISKKELLEITDPSQKKQINNTEIKFILQKQGINIDMRIDTVDDFHTAIGLFKKTTANA